MACTKCRLTSSALTKPHAVAWCTKNDAANRASDGASVVGCECRWTPTLDLYLTLTDEQSSRIDAVFQATIPNLRQQRQELDEQEAKLSRLIAANVDEAQVIRQVDKVEAIRASANKMRTLMLLRMRQVLSPEQRAKLNKLYEQWEKDHRRGPRGEIKK